MSDPRRDQTGILRCDGGVHIITDGRTTCHCGTRTVGPSPSVEQAKEVFASRWHGWRDGCNFYADLDALIAACRAESQSEIEDRERQIMSMNQTIEEQADRIEALEAVVSSQSETIKRQFEDYAAEGKAREAEIERLKVTGTMLDSLRECIIQALGEEFVTARDEVWADGNASLNSMVAIAVGRLRNRAESAEAKVTALEAEIARVKTPETP